MKIQGTTGTGKTAGAKKSGKVSKSGGGNFSDFMTSGAGDTSSVPVAASINSMDALLAVQAADDAAERPAKKRMMLRANRILDELDRIRNAVLCGNLSVGDILRVADMVASHREKVDDPKLTAILDEIDLRAQIEIAKMKKGL